MRFVQVLLLFFLSFFITECYAQVTFPVNDVADPRTRFYAFTNATIVKDANTTLQNATLVIKDGKIISVNTAAAPATAVVIDCKGRYIYPSFIDMFSDYGMPAVTRTGSGSFFGPQQLVSSTTGPYNWNQAIKSEFNASDVFKTDEAKARQMRDLGFGAVLSHQKDGIARGTGTIVTLTDEKENLAIIKDKAAAFYSFDKGTSTQTYPTSMMGAVALLRQTYLDAQWYKTKPPKEGINKSLEVWSEIQSLPQIFESNDKWGDLRADRIGDEFGVQYIIKAGGNEYQRINEVVATKAPLIVALNYPETQNVEDPLDARFVALSDLAHWELAPTNLAAIEKAAITFAITSADLKTPTSFWPNLRKAVENGLSTKAALDALTKTPATLLKIYDKTGSLEPGKLANFIVTTGDIFLEKSGIIENWVQGKKFIVDPKGGKEQSGIYDLVIHKESGIDKYVLDVRNNNQANIYGKDTLTTRFKSDGKTVSLAFSLKPSATEKKDSVFNKSQAASLIRLSGIDYGTTWQGIGTWSDGKPISWLATWQRASVGKKDTASKKANKPLSKVVYPFMGYGNEQLPQQETILIKNATVWTNESDGRLLNTDVLLSGGKIVQIGKNITAVNARQIDGTGKHLTPGIIDEHSHIAAFSINEGAQSVTSEVRIGDNINPDDINIYRQLSGGVTTSHILHGSANAIGGQTQLIKLRWGANDEDLKFKGADPFIKFALGENVKRTAQPSGNIRFPDTRMGVEEVMADAFQRAKDYEKALMSGRKDVRRDIELDALVEILHNKRFITCHSYVQSEILSLINVAEKYGFKVNTFTHILEGYKVADRLKQHGANASTFSDWWAYKNEVRDAIAYNAAIMHNAGINVCINSDDAEMARRLNQEAAKVIKYGGVSEEDAFKMVTLNAAKALHIDGSVGSIKKGKDADVVLWSDNPLSIYAKALYTIVDGTVYFDRAKDAEKQKQISAERNRLIQKMIADGKAGAPTINTRPTPVIILHCEDENEHEDHASTYSAYQD